ncbi:hypothetical protein [Streptomyces sp. SID8499]|uniref:hypothetical protein n=1 Tax=Streptomyces sp. SID8499 TaxID=2706106 RepID=UPI0013C78BC9|nr:hypothetical protein [Streptomyces sp. SID8499]NED37627.1 hypothetical protein [Streptomyces sp. SID8499]
MSAAENPSRPYPATGVCMSDLLASCAAAAAVSLPPRAPEPVDAAPDPRTGARTPRTDPRAGSTGVRRDAPAARAAHAARTVETHREAA